jgi:hypothetical protein
VNPSLVEVRPCRPSSVCLLRAGTGGRCAHRFAGGSPEGNPPNLPNLGLALASPRLPLKGQALAGVSPRDGKRVSYARITGAGTPGSGTSNISSADYTRAVPTFDLTDDELAAVTAAIRRAIETDRFPRAPRLDPLRSALAKLEPAPAPKPTLQPKAPPPAKADKRARR